MNLSGLSELLLAWAKSQGTALLGPERSSTQGLPFQPGREYGARVLDNLPNGRHLVQVASQKLDMSLPRGTQPGESLRLTYLGGGARPTFLLNQTAQIQAANPAQPVSLSSAAQQVSALSRLSGTGSAMNAGAPRTGAPATVSAGPAPLAPGPGSGPGGVPASANVARALASQSVGVEAPLRQAGATSSRSNPGSALVTQNGTQTVARMQASVTASTAPSTTASMANAGTVASTRPIATTEMLAGPSVVRSPAAPSTLQNPSSAPVIATGGRPIAANVVMLNAAVSATPLSPGGVASPNTALVGQAVDGLRAAVPSSTTLTPNVLAELPGPSRSMLPTRLFQSLSESGLFYESHLARWAKGDLSFDTLLREPQARIGRDLPIGTKVAELGGMPDEVARLAGRQLQLLDGAPLVWQGFAWPGQWMQWLVEERYPESGEGGANEDDAGWATELHLHLPRMGSVHARIGLRGDRLDLHLTAQDLVIRNEMQAALPALVKGLEAAGLQPLKVLVDLPGEA